MLVVRFKAMPTAGVTFPKADGGAQLRSIPRAVVVFKLYWAVWALLLAGVARLLRVRGRERDRGVRLELARRRFTRPTAWTAAAAVGLILTLGGFIFYNTNVLNEYFTASDIVERRAEYERRYGRY
ncbi:MAG: hypothetical protein CYG59_02705, partial [Chloroflexi bacterium]